MYIKKHIKRKEYPTASEFAADVELVFSNALTFNQEHTLIWEDARVLRVKLICYVTNVL
jgi:chromatin structure-remodeling complex subunit RSC4